MERMPDPWITLATNAFESVTSRATFYRTCTTPCKYLYDARPETSRILTESLPRRVHI